MLNEQVSRIAMIGLGPRGLGALEALATHSAAKEIKFNVDVFDPYPAPGAGPNFDPEDSPLCLLNIPMRDIQLRPPKGSGISGFADWVAPPIPNDAFPPRPQLGAYLQARLEALLAQQSGQSGQNLTLTHLPASVDQLRQDEGHWHLLSGGIWHGPYAEILMVPGQPKTQPDDQLGDWQTHAKHSRATLAGAYPADKLQASAKHWAGQTVAIRGFALSSFDVIRVLTTGLGGTFGPDGYSPSGQEPKCILPFSLDGKPPYPKPETEALDHRFQPTADETNAFAKAIAKAASAPAPQAQEIVCDALLPVIERILNQSGARSDPKQIFNWLQSEWSDPGSQENTSPREVLEEGIALAQGDCPATIGYVVGQVWRKWQDPLRQGYNPTDTEPKTAAALLGFDEGLKRYSYGPPVSSCQEVLSLISAGIVSLDHATDPDIDLTSDGWKLSTDQGSMVSEIMIDAVLPSPDPEQVRAPLIEQLIQDGWLTLLGKGLSTRTTPDGTLITSADRPAPGLCLLGRLALGSVIAADSLHDCFGQAAARWAEGVVGRHTAQPDG